MKTASFTKCYNFSTLSDTDKIKEFLQELLEQSGALYFDGDLECFIISDTALSSDAVKKITEAEEKKQSNKSSVITTDETILFDFRDDDDDDFLNWMNF